MPYTYDYPRPALTVDTIVFRKCNNRECVLLIERKHDPFIGKWALPGGFLDYDEEIMDAAKRELKEETGLVIDRLIQLGAYGKIGRDPRGRTVSIVFITEISENDSSNIQAGDDAEKAEWFPVDALPVLAFDHDEIMQDALEARRSLS